MNKQGAAIHNLADVIVDHILDALKEAEGMVETKWMVDTVESYIKEDLPEINSQLAAEIQRLKQQADMVPILTNSNQIWKDEVDYLKERIAELEAGIKRFARDIESKLDEEVEECECYCRPEHSKDEYICPWCYCRFAIEALRKTAKGGDNG